MLTGNPKFNNKYGNPVGNNICSSLINYFKGDKPYDRNL